MSTGCSAISRSLHVSVLLAGVLALHSPPSSSAFQAGKPGEQTARPQQTVIRISKATTRITAPLDARGFVDYISAFEARAARGVTPQNNFEVIVRNVMRLDTVPTASIGRYYARIGIPVPDKDRPVFQRCDKYLRSLPSFQDYEDLDISSDDRKSVPAEEWQVSTRPWKAVEHPEVAGWLAKNGRFLDQLVEGSRRTGYYVPYFINDESEAEPLSPLRMTPRYGEACGQLRHPGSGLNIRVMQRIGAGELDQAWSDIQALRRIASHLENRLTVTETLDASFFREWEFRAEIHLLNTSGFTDRQARQIFEVLRPQIDFVPMYDDVMFARRFTALDTVAVLARSSGEKNRSRFLRHSVAYGLDCCQQRAGVCSGRYHVTDPPEKCFESQGVRGGCSPH